MSFYSKATSGLSEVLVMLYCSYSWTCLKLSGARASLFKLSSFPFPTPVGLSISFHVAFNTYFFLFVFMAASEGKWAAENESIQEASSVWLARANLSQASQDKVRENWAELLMDNPGEYFLLQCWAALGTCSPWSLSYFDVDFSF